MMQSRVPPLFDVLPDGLFNALAAPNRQLHWFALFGLFRARFGPDAPAQPIDGYPKSEILHDLTNLLTEAGVRSEESADTSTTIEILAANTLSQFGRWGWFVIERIGVRERVSMRPQIVEFMTRLVDFIERGPVFLGAEVRSIALQLNDILTNEGPAASFQKAAADSRAILNHLASTRLQIRDVMAEINQATSTAEFARKFFANYVSKLFIADYSELKLRNHPLSRRGEILELARRISESQEVRGRLTAWYARELAANDVAIGEQLFERDVRRILDLEAIDQHLERLDREFHSANKRAIAYMNYRIQAPKDFDRLLASAIHAAKSAIPALNDSPAPPGDLISETRLREPRTEMPEIPRQPIAKKIPTLEQRAIANLERAAIERRQVNAKKVAKYLARTLRDRQSISCEELPIETIEDLRLYQTLCFAGMEPIGDLSPANPIHAILCGARVEIDYSRMYSNGVLTTPHFVVHRPRPRGTKRTT